MKRGIVRISPKLLLELFQYENGTVIDARMNHFNGSGTIELLIEHEDMPEVQEGEEVRIIAPSYTRTFDKKGHLIEIKRQK